MFSNVGWGEILLILVVGLILIGPERLPQLAQDVRALILAARRVIEDARNSIDTEFKDDLDELRKPLEGFGDLRKLNPRTAITKTLFEGDDTYLDMLSGKPAVGGGKEATTQSSAGTQRRARGRQANQESAAPAASEPYPVQETPADKPPANKSTPTSWVDDDVL